MDKTKIRWADTTWNVMSGCTHVSPGCDRCYAEVIATSPRFANGFPNGFDPTFKPKKLGDPKKWRKPRRVFVNSMSDVHHEAFTRDEIDSVYDVMVDVSQHHYLVLTKRPQAMARFFLGPDGYLARRGLDRVPAQIWLGTSIESDRYAFRANHLRRIPVDIRFISAEPLIGPLPSLDLAGFSWLIVGGESGNGTRDFRVMDHEWAVDLRDAARAAGTAFFFKQSSGVRTETGIELAGERIEEWPVPHPDPVHAAGLFAEAG
ncbi:MAG TPA: DUF5131 family protein [Acidimicrobiia bacterium]|nr:DUF5131 family protein [Acidimicrobiia bacterium]